jgi:hypothetical protein
VICSGLDSSDLEPFGWRWGCTTSALNLRRYRLRYGVEPSANGYYEARHMCVHSYLLLIAVCDHCHNVKLCDVHSERMPYSKDYIVRHFRSVRPLLVLLFLWILGTILIRAGISWASLR